MFLPSALDLVAQVYGASKDDRSDLFRQVTGILSQHYQELVTCVRWRLGSGYGDQDAEEVITQFAECSLPDVVERFNPAKIHKGLFWPFFSIRLGWACSAYKRLHPPNLQLTAWIKACIGTAAEQEQAVLRNETTEIVRAILAKLPQRDSQILQLAYYDNLNNQKRAALLGITPGAERVAFLRARTRFKELYISKVRRPS
jgi:RNA polymerase sigma factor (sigma-70 family)